MMLANINTYLNIKKKCTFKFPEEKMAVYKLTIMCTTGGKRNFLNIWAGHTVKWVSSLITYKCTLTMVRCSRSNCSISVILKIAILFIWGLCCAMLITYKYIGCPATPPLWTRVISTHNVFRNTVVSKIHDDISLTVNATLTDHYKIIIWNIFEKNDNELKTL